MAITITVDGVLRTGADWQGENDVLAISQQPFATPQDARLKNWDINAAVQTKDPFVYNAPAVTP